MLNAPVTEEPSPVQVVVAEPCKLNPALHVVVQMLPKALSSSQLRPPLTIGAGSGQVIAIQSKIAQFWNKLFLTNETYTNDRKV